MACLKQNTTDKYFQMTELLISLVRLTLYGMLSCCSLPTAGGGSCVASGGSLRTCISLTMHMYSAYCAQVHDLWRGCARLAVHMYMKDLSTRHGMLVGTTGLQ